jgi:hypothetical protein
MSKKLRGFCVLAALCALSLLLLSCGSSSSRPSGLLYVLTQGSTGVGNNVSSFSINLDSGSLSLINSNASTCSTLTGSNPVSCGLPIDIVLDPTAATAFVLNQGAPCVQGVSCVSPCGPGTNPLTPCASVPPTIYPYTVNSDGSFSSPGTPVILSHPTSATDTEDDADTAIHMVRDAAGTFLFVLSQGSVPSPAICPHDPAPGLNFDACPSISVFSSQPGSTTLTLAGGKPFRLSRIPTGISTVSFTTSAGTAKELVLVSSNSDPILHNDNTVSVYAVGSDGTLSEQIGSPYATETDPISVQAVNTNPSTGGNTGGVFVYVGVQPTSSGALDAFQVCTVQNATCSSAQVNNSTLIPVGTPTSAGQLPISMLVDPTDNFLYVAAQGTNQVFGFKINTTSGELSALSPASQPTGSQPVALAMHPAINSAGQFLYVSNSASSNISGFAVSTTTGSMSSPTTVISPAGPSGMAAK